MFDKGSVPKAVPVLEIECIPKLVIIVSDCIPGFRSVCPMCIPTFKCVYPMCIPTFSSFIVLRAQFPSPSFPCDSSPDTMKQLSLKPHLTAPSAKDDDSSSSSGSPAPFFMVCMYHMCIPGFSSVYPVCISKTKSVCPVLVWIHSISRSGPYLLVPSICFSFTNPLRTPGVGWGGDAFERKGPQRRPQER